MIEDRMRWFASRLTRMLALAALAAVIMTVGMYAISAQDSHDSHSDDEHATASTATTLTVEGAASRSVAHDGTVARFTVEVLRKSVLPAVNTGNRVVQKIADAIAEQCATEAPTDEDQANPESCVSPDGLQTTSVRISEEFDWAEGRRVSIGYQYSNSLSIAIIGTAAAGALVDIVTGPGGNDLRFNGLDFTASGTPRAEREALLAAIDDAQSTARSIVDHMGYEIVRIVEVRPTSGVSPHSARSGVADEEALEADFAPTPVFGGSQTVTSSVQIVYEIAPSPSDDD